MQKVTFCWANRDLSPVNRDLSPCQVSPFTCRSVTFPLVNRDPFPQTPAPPLVLHSSYEIYFGYIGYIGYPL